MDSSYAGADRQHRNLMAVGTGAPKEEDSKIPCPLAYKRKGAWDLQGRVFFAPEPQTHDIEPLNVGIGRVAWAVFDRCALFIHCGIPPWRPRIVSRGCCSWAQNVAGTSKWERSEG